MWNKIFNCSKLFFVALNEKLGIFLANDILTQTLGFEKQDELLGKNWLQFIPEEEKEVVRHVHLEVRTNDTDCHFRESINDLITPENTIRVRWFNDLLNFGLKGTFSIGVPLGGIVALKGDTQKVRDFFQQQIEKDRTTIQAISEMTKKL